MRLATIGLVAGLSVLGGCAAGESHSHGGPVVDHVSFVDHLRRQGYTVEIGDSVEQPFARVEGIVLKVSGNELAQPIELQSFHYEKAKDAASDADAITPEGGLDGTQIDWVEPPHFYRRERVLVLYTGSDPTALEILGELLGPQFAGRSG